MKMRQKFIRKDTERFFGGYFKILRREYLE